ncbi:MAG: bifunctional DNA-formamidopyrimidine glycosylase/DNA-(apurinic or apyrimidinic site) lyase [Alphaproteobacteria bacterium]|nr:bifunctional DNA-formamidopyrimidine glycosylase/DNA-(apurinic or apyrimidinic site) lyase [Alphaproteobacteria bacterium]
MPELPEVETVRSGLAQAIEGKKISAVKIHRRDLRIPVPASFEKDASGRKIDHLIRRGKYILFFLDGPKALALHLGMSGRIRIEKPGETKTPEKHDHAILYIEDGTQIIFHDPRRFGLLTSIEQNNWEEAGFFKHMGPEPLGNWGAEPLAASIKSRKAPIKQALLDQSVVAGLGNIYVCEALYRAHIDPRRPADSLTKKECAALGAHVKDVLIEAIKAGGSSLKDYRQTDGALGYFQHGFRVYDRAGQSCPEKNCKGEIIRIVQSGRSTFYCPVCQK